MKRAAKTCVHPSGYFWVGIHEPSYNVLNHRLTNEIIKLGEVESGTIVKNEVNFPNCDLDIKSAQPIYEIPNSFPFWGTTYILGDVAARKAESDIPISFFPAGQTSFDKWSDFEKIDINFIPRPIILTIAQTCKNPNILKKLLPLCAEFIVDSNGQIKGLKYEKSEDGNIKAKIKDHDLYETLGNNPYLDDDLKRLLLLNPGVQGSSPIVGEYLEKGKCHIWEYLRANSYIPWGHYASNMAQDSIRYSVDELDIEDIRGLRHLYYQRIYTQLASILGFTHEKRGLFSEDELESLRAKIANIIKSKQKDLPFSSTLWGWNYGYDFSGSGFRLHASHQQIHQQFALIPENIKDKNTQNELPTYAIGDLVASFIKDYQEIYGRSFFDALISAILSNKRTDGRDDLEKSLVIFKDENVMVYVPKAQRSQGEIQVLCLKKVGNILEADLNTRRSLDKGILIAVKVLSSLGARMITCIEISKRFNSSEDQHLFYSFLPKHPQSPGAFSEQQGRWITGHFPEDFAKCCRKFLSSAFKSC